MRLSLDRPGSGAPVCNVERSRYRGVTHSPLPSSPTDMRSEGYPSELGSSVKRYTTPDHVNPAAYAHYVNRVRQRQHRV